jgi:polysaccharide lyase-like protein
VRLVLCAVAVLILAALVVGLRGDLFERDPSHPVGPTGRATPAGRVFAGDFETGDVSQWTGNVQCANTSSAPMLFTRGTITVQSDIVGEGSHAARIDLPAADDKMACEALSTRPIGVGTDDYYGLMVRFPTDWREPSPAGWGLAIAQLNYEGIWGAPLSLNAHADTVALVLQSGLCRSVYTSTPGCTYSSGLGGNLPRTYAIPAPLALGVWHELIVHVRWATDSSGLVEAWHRLKGGSAWNKTLSVTGYPTVQWTADTGPEAIASIGTNDKIGAYRGQADFPLSVWHDGFVRTTSFASASSAMP